MKVLLATSTVTPNAGIPSFNRELCRLLGKSHHIDLLVNENLKEYTGYHKVFSVYGISDFNSTSWILKEINEEKYDLIINSNSHFASIITPYINNSTKIITISHSLGTLDCDNAAFNHEYIDHVIALSHNCKNYLLHRFPSLETDKVNVIFNSVSFQENCDRMRSTKESSNVIKIVFAGGTAPSKSPEIVFQILLDLCKYTDINFEFYWLGNTTPPLKIIQPYHDIRQILPTDDRIHILGRIPQEHAAKIIAECNIFLAPSKREGFPMALLEAMRIGCIPIVSDYDIANKEIIIDKENGFVCHRNNIDEFVNRIIDVIKNHNKYKSIYKASYDTFIDKLCFPIWEKNIINIITDKSISHHSRLKKMTHWGYIKQKIRFLLLDNYNLIENQIKEVAPSAIKFYKFYKEYNKTCQ